MKRHSVSFLLNMLVLCALAFGVGAAEKGLSGEDKMFLKEAASGGLMEVQLGQMAQQKGQSPEVKDFGSKMATDHGKANEELKALAQKKNEKIPEKPDSKHKKIVDKLSKASGPEFDKEYMTAMVKDRTKDVSDFRNVGMKAKDPDLNAWAAKTAPVLEGHLKQSREIAQKMGIDVNKAEAEGLKEAKKSK